MMVTWELVLVALVSIAVMGGSVGFGLWISRRTREQHNDRARLVSATFAAVAARRGDIVVPGQAYDHPMAGEFLAPSRVRGERGALTFRMTYTQGGSDDPDLFTISVTPTRAPARSLKANSRDLSPESQALVRELVDLGHRVHVDADGPGGSPALVVTVDETRKDALDPEVVASLVERAVALAAALDRH